LSRSSLTVKECLSDCPSDRESIKGRRESPTRPPTISLSPLTPPPRSPPPLPPHPPPSPPPPPPPHPTLTPTNGLDQLSLPCSNRLFPRPQVRCAKRHKLFLEVPSMPQSGFQPRRMKGNEVLRRCPISSRRRVPIHV